MGVSRKSGANIEISSCCSLGGDSVDISHGIGCDHKISSST
jgi:hypothetical protein